MTLVEVMVALAIFTVCGYLLSSTITATVAQSVGRREMSIAAEAARNQFEDLRNEDFRQLFALYNLTRADDPDGAGTAPGPHFDVPGLKALEADADGMAGQIILPSNGLALFENSGSVELDMPRDLNGDAFIDGVDHALDYQVLPVLIRIEWRGFAGRRQFQMATMLANVEKSP